MASRQSLANRAHYELIAGGSDASQTPEDARLFGDAHWTMLTGEPGGVDYLETDAAGTRAMWLVPHARSGDAVLLCVHGGGFVGGSIYTHRKMYGHLAKAAGLKALLVGYSRIDQAPWPTQLDQVMNACLWLVGTGIDPSRILLAGDSAGGLLTIAALVRMRAERLAIPAGAMCISGWFDMSAAGPSYDANAAKDPFFKRETVQWLGSQVAKDRDPASPDLSPLYADLSGLPPLYLQVGSDETLLDDSRWLAERARAQGVEVMLDIFPGMLHSFQMMAGRAPEADHAIAKLASWTRRALDF